MDWTSFFLNRNQTRGGGGSQDYIPSSDETAEEEGGCSSSKLNLHHAYAGARQVEESSSGPRIVVTLPVNEVDYVGTSQNRLRDNLDIEVVIPNAQRLKNTGVKENTNPGVTGCPSHKVPKLFNWSYCLSIEEEG